MMFSASSSFWHHHALQTTTTNAISVDASQKPVRRFTSMSSMVGSTTGSLLADRTIPALVGAREVELVGVRETESWVPFKLLLTAVTTPNLFGVCFQFFRAPDAYHPFLQQNQPFSLQPGTASVIRRSIDSCCLVMSTQQAAAFPTLSKVTPFQ